MMVRDMPPVAAEQAFLQRLDDREDDQYEHGRGRRGQVEAPAGREPDRGDHPDAGRRGQSVHRLVIPQYGPGAEEPDPADDLGRDAGRVEDHATRARTSANPYAETIITSADPTLTSMCVRSPADLSSRCRSRPIRLPRTAATRVGGIALEVPPQAPSDDLADRLALVEQRHGASASIGDDRGGIDAEVVI